VPPIVKIGPLLVELLTPAVPLLVTVVVPPEFVSTIG
jgi:hypothetical protein